MRKKILKIIKWSAGIILFIISILVAITLIFSDEITAAVKAEINKNLLTKVDVKEVSFSVFEKFPNATIKLSDVFITDPFTTTDTLLQSKEVFLSFNLLDLWKEKYSIKQLSIENGTLNLKTNFRGEHNFNIWKSSELDSSQVSFDIQELNAEKIKFSYLHSGNKFYCKSFLENTSFSGNFSAQKIKVQANGNLTLHELSKNEKVYVTDKSIHFFTGFEWQKGEEVLHFPQSEVQLNGLNFIVKGNVGYGNQGTIQLFVKGSNHGFESVANLFSDFLPQELHSLIGQVDYSSEIIYKPTGNKNIAIDFDLTNGNYSIDSLGLKFTETRVKGAYNFDFENNQNLMVQSYSTLLNNSTIAGNGTLQIQPVLAYDFNLKGILAPNNFEKLFSMQTKINGEIPFDINFKSKGTGNDILENIRLNGNGKIRNLEVIEMSSINSNWNIKNNQLFFDSLVFKANGSEFLANGIIRGLKNHLIKGSTIAIESEVFADKIELNQWLETNTNSQKTSIEKSLPVQFNLKTKVESIHYDKIRINNFKGVFKGNVENIRANSIYAETCNGNIVGEVSLTKKANKYFVSSLIKTTNLNVKQLFGEWDNFGQAFIQKKHLEGKLNATVKLSSDLDSEFQIIPSTLKSNIDLSIKNGELIGFEPLKETSEYVREKKILKSLVDIETFEKNLEHIRFSTLENQISIENEEIKIPHMSVQSSAMDINIEGVHGFNNEVNYGVDFQLKELKEESVTEFGVIEDDGLGTRIFIRIKGTPDDFNFYYDKEAVKGFNKKKRQQEKEKIKQIFRAEFSKKDTSKAPKQKSDTAFEIQWEEESEKSKDSTKTKEQPEKKSRWQTMMEKIGLENDSIPDDDF